MTQTDDPLHGDIDLRDEKPPKGEGWETYDSRSPFSSRHGRMYQKFPADGEAVRAFWAKRRHCNSAGIVHGGMLMAHVDALMGMTVWQATRTTSLTVRMTTDFLSIARPGDWVEAHARVSRATKSVAFVNAEVTVGRRRVMTAQGIFKLMPRHKMQA